MNPDENLAYKVTEKISFPRLVSSKGEKEAFELIKQEIKKIGYDDIKNEAFLTSFLVWKLVKIYFLIVGILLITSGISLLFFPWLSLIISGLVILLLFKALGISDAEEIQLYKENSRNFETHNLFFNQKSNKSKATIVFLGHWDSKSQTFPVSLRMIFFIISVFGTILTSICVIVISIINVFTPFSLDTLNWTFLIISVAIALIGFTNVFNSVQNKSPGSIDNATSVGTIISLAKYFKENPLENIDFVFLLTGSEELNLGGAKVFVKNHKQEFSNKNTYFINLDAIGTSGIIRVLTSYGIPRKMTSKLLNDLFIKAANTLKNQNLLHFDVKTIYIPTGAWGDHQPFVNAGFEACTIGSSGAVKNMHTPEDNISIVSKQGLKDVLMLCVEVVKELNSKFI